MGENRLGMKMRRRSPRMAKPDGIGGVTRAVLLVALCALSVANGCGGSDYDLKARAIAERWSENNGEAVAREMAGLLVDDAPGVASLGSETLARQIGNGIGWRYGEPSCDRDGGCKLTATASSEINISVPFVVSKTVMVELPFRLEIDARGAVASGAATVTAAPQIGAAEIVGQ